MANVRAIRTRIKSVQSTQKITKSMKMVAAAKLKRTQQSMTSLRPYADAARQMLQRVGTDPEARQNIYLTPREVKRVCYVLFVGNRGLCGVYNTALLKYMEALAERETRPFSVLVVGRWGRDLLAASGLPIGETMENISDAPSPQEARTLGEKLKAMYSGGEADEIVLVYERYCSALRQEPESRILLPLTAEEAGVRQTEYLIEPDAAALGAQLGELYLDSVIYATLLEARTGEHSARMTAMTAASDNTEQLLGKLNLQLNHARQAAITTEISEIVGGANALNAK